MKPKYKRASHTGEYIVLENRHLKFVIYKRLRGWGFGELYSPEGKLLAVLDHFGELLLRDQEIPMRIEADSFTKTEENGTVKYVFPVKTTMPREKLKGTSFEPWVKFPFDRPVLEGQVEISLGEDDREIRYGIRLESNFNVYASYLRLFWLLCGEGSYGCAKTDAILPGVDWPIYDEWSSGNDFFKDPWANRCIPHPSKIGSPVMALSHGEDAVGVAFDLDTAVTRWFNYNEYYPQPVFAVPNFIERSNNSLLGIMLPDVKTEEQENKPFASVPLEIHIGQRFAFDARLYTVKGTSLDALVYYVKQNGLPTPVPKYTPDEAIEKIANAYNTNLYHENEGFGTRQKDEDGYSKAAPGFIYRFIKENPDSELAKQLSEKIARLKKDSNRQPPSHEEIMKAARENGDRVLSWQKEDGSFRFEPDGRHYTKDDFRVARAFIEPMGRDGDTALYMNTEPADRLISAYEKTGDEKYKAGAKKALDFCLDMIRPEGGDYWETPLHAPNLLAAGVSANVYYRAYTVFGDEKYKNKAIRLWRSLLVFTHLRRPKTVNSLYNTKPCLCSSDWYFANWVRDFVQWEMLHSLNMASHYGFDWAEIDPEIEWSKFRYGVTVAAYNWMVDSKDLRWRPHNIPGSLDRYLSGEYDTCFADTFNSVTGNIGGMVIAPSAIGDSVYACKSYKDC